MTRVKHCALALIVVIAAAGSYGQVTFERLVNAAKEPQNWLTYSGDYAGRRFSPLDQINTANARSLLDARSGSTSVNSRLTSGHVAAASIADLPSSATKYSWPRSTPTLSLSTRRPEA